MANPTSQPGDPDFDWSQYPAYRQANPDPLTAAQEFLSRPDILGSGKTNAAAGQDYASAGRPMSGPVPAQGPMLGERRVGKTETVEWRGDKWAPVEHDPNVAPGGSAGYHPGLNTSPGNAMLQGFLSGSAGEVTPGKVGTVAALSAPWTGGASIPAAAGLEGLAQMVQSHYGTPNAPTGPGEAALGIGEAAAMPALGAGIGKAYELAPALASVDKVTGPVGGALGAYEGYQRGGVPGAVMGGATGYAGGKAVPKALGWLGKLAGIGGGTAEEAAGAGRAAESGAGGEFGAGIRQPTSTYSPTSAATPRPTSDFWPAGSTVEPTAPTASLTPRDPGWTPTGRGTPAPTPATTPNPATDQNWRTSTMDLGPGGGRTTGSFAPPNLNLQQAISAMPSQANLSADMQDTVGTWGRGPAGQTAADVANTNTPAQSMFRSSEWSSPTPFTSSAGGGPPSAGNVEPPALAALPPEMTASAPTGPPSAGNTVQPGLGPGRIRAMQDAIQQRGDWTTGTAPNPAMAAPGSTTAVPPSIRAITPTNPSTAEWGPNSVSLKTGQPATQTRGMILDPTVSTTDYIRQISRLRSTGAATDTARADKIASGLRQRQHIVPRP